MTATLAPPESVAAWLVCHLIDDGVHVWCVNDILVVNGPPEARRRWAGVLGAFNPVLVAYLRREVVETSGVEGAG